MNNKSNLKKFIYLINFELSSVLFKTLIAAGMLIIIQLISFTAVILNDKNKYLRFEELAIMAGYSKSFFITAALVLGIIAFCFYKNWLGSKNIYALLCIPINRSFIYFSKLIAAVISIIILMTMQTVNIFLSYCYYLFALPQVPKLRNGLLLSFIRWDFLHLFYPSSLSEVITSITYILVGAVVVLFVIILERSGYYRKALLVVFISVIIILLPIPFGVWVKWIFVGVQLGAYSLKLLGEGSVA